VNRDGVARDLRVQKKATCRDPKICRAMADR